MADVSQPFHVQISPRFSQDLASSYDHVTSQLATISNGEHAEGSFAVDLPTRARLQLELDGSFVWVGDGWQVDGMLYDIGDRMRYVDLKGTCPRSVWRFLWNLVAGTDATAVIVRLPAGGLYELQDFEAETWV